MKVKPYSINLSEQMAVCDANYIRISKLLGGVLPSNSREVLLPALGESAFENAQTLVIIETVETFKYTTTIKISQKFSLKTDPLQSKQNVQYDTPEMLIRMYHDANTAEVISYQGHRNFKANYPLPNKNMYHADEKEQLNLFLSQWLQLCQREGLHPGKQVSENFLACLESE